MEIHSNRSERVLYHLTHSNGHLLEHLLKTILDVQCLKHHAEVRACSETRQVNMHWDECINDFMNHRATLEQWLHSPCTVKGLALASTEHVGPARADVIQARV